MPFDSWTWLVIQSMYMFLSFCRHSRNRFISLPVKRGFFFPVQLFCRPSTQIFHLRLFILVSLTWNKRRGRRRQSSNVSSRKKNERQEKSVSRRKEKLRTTSVFCYRDRRRDSPFLFKKSVDIVLVFFFFPLTFPFRLTFCTCFTRGIRVISHGILSDFSSSLDGRDEKKRKDRWMSRSSLTLGVDSALIFMDHDVYFGLTPHPQVRSLQSMKQSPSLMTDILVVVLVLRLIFDKMLEELQPQDFPCLPRNRNWFLSFLSGQSSFFSIFSSFIFLLCNYQFSGGNIEMKEEEEEADEI